MEPLVTVTVPVTELAATPPLTNEATAGPDSSKANPEACGVTLVAWARAANVWRGSPVEVAPLTACQVVALRWYADGPIATRSIVFAPATFSISWRRSGAE